MTYRYTVKDGAGQNYRTITEGTLEANGPKEARALARHRALRVGVKPRFITVTPA